MVLEFFLIPFRTFTNQNQTTFVIIIVIKQSTSDVGSKQISRGNYCFGKS